MASAIPDEAKPSMRLALELLTAWYAADDQDFSLLEERLDALSAAGGPGDRVALDGLVQLTGVLLTGYAEGAGMSPPDALALLGRWLA
ncbi:MAG TPA: hypothetical protein VHW92_05120 [Mycobacteriales bacterium]|nr:hypothetical protein [Mycobacteriales bacterium]